MMTQYKEGKTISAVAAFFFIPGIQDADVSQVTQAFLAINHLHSILKSAFEKNPEITILSSLYGAIVIIPDKSNLTLHHHIQGINDSAKHFKLPLKIGVADGELECLTDIDEEMNFIGRPINIAARLAVSDKNEGLLYDSSYYEQVRAAMNKGVYFPSPEEIKIPGKEHDEPFMGHRPINPVTFDGSLDEIAGNYPSDKENEKNALIVAFDLPRFSRGDGSELSSRFRALIDAFNASFSKYPELTYNFSPGGDGGILVITGTDNKEIAFDFSKTFMEKLDIEGDHRDESTQVLCKIGIHSGTVPHYVNARGKLRPTGLECFIADKLADKCEPGSIVFSKRLAEAFAGGSNKQLQENFQLLKLQENGPAKEMKRYLYPNYIKKSETTVKPANSGKKKVTILTEFSDAGLEDIIGRDEDLKEIEAILEKDKNVVLINGLGGIGKTSAAKAFAGKNKGKYGHFAWLDASESFLAACVNSGFLISSLKINTKDYSEAAKLQAEVLARLKEMPGENLLIIDNAGNDLEKEYGKLCALENWKIIVTSRQELNRFTSYKIDTLQPGPAKKLFRKHCAKDCAEPALEDFLVLIGYHTLSIELLAKTLQLLPEYTLEKLTEYLTGHKLNADELKIDLTGISHAEQEKYVQVYSHLLNAFQLSGLDEAEIWTLRQFSVLPSVEIESQDFLKYTQIETGKQDYINALTHLAQKGWLDSKRPSCYTAHPIVREIVRYRAEPSYQVCGALVKTFTDKLELRNADIPLEKLKWVRYGESLLECLKDEISEIAVLQFNLARVFCILADYDKAIVYYDKALKIYIKTLGENHPSVADTYNDLGIVYQNKGEFDIAIQYYDKALKIYIETLGENHPSVASTYNNLGLVYENKGEFDIAIQYYDKALKIYENSQVPGNHPDILKLKNNIRLAEESKNK